MRREALGSIDDGGAYLLLWQPYPDAFTRLYLRDVQRDGDRLQGTGGDGEPMEVGLDEVLAVIDLDCSVQRLLAQKMAWRELLPDLLAPFEGREGLLIIERDGVLVVDDHATYIGQGEGGFRFASADGVQVIASDSLLGLEV